MKSQSIALLIVSSLCACAVSAEELVPLKPKLPAAAFVGTPKDVPVGGNVEAPSKTPRPPLMIPADAKNIAPQARISSSDTNALPTALAKITDGDKEAFDTSIVLLRKGTQYVQFDLGGAQEIFALVIWHAHDTPKIYRDVIVQVADDAGMTQNLQTLYNNDIDDSSKRGVGADKEYFENFEGRTIDGKGAKGRYVRLYSKGSTDSTLNEYTEVEIYARPAK
ncbi:MAG: hypothetical protein U1F65_08285 [Verrucomicrobiota bacterium]